MIYKILRRVTAKAKRTAGAIGTRVRVRAASRHLSGPRKIRLEEDEVALVCMLKNGSYYLDALLEHHRAIGIRHFLFIDNGSEDDTIEKLASQPDVTIISNQLPVATYESLLRGDIARRVIKGGWFLFVDSDELIEMVHGTGRDIRDYAGYCNEHGYDAVVVQCLDLFSSRPLLETEGWSYRRSISDFNLFSLRCISDFDYHDKAVAFAWFLQSNTVTSPDIKIKFGGIRREMFGEDCALSSHRMIKNAGHIGLYSHPHCSSNVRCADFSILLRHYKFAGKYLSRERQQVRDRVWNHGEDRSRLAIINGQNFTLAGQEVQRFAGTGPLLEQGFLTGSAAFLARFPPPEQARPKDQR